MSEADGYKATIDGISFRLKEPFDFTFLKKYGQVFKVLDDQDSGNICFGVDDGVQKYFIKFAGAPTVRANVSAEEAATVLKQSTAIYRDLAHPILTRLINAEEIGGGFAAVFEWTDAICMAKMCPEEFTLGAEIDEITNVYTMGATAFALLAKFDRTQEKWPLCTQSYEVANKAVSNNREERQQSIRQFIQEWKTALSPIL